MRTENALYGVHPYVLHHDEIHGRDEKRQIRHGTGHLQKSYASIAIMTKMTGCTPRIMPRMTGLSDSFDMMPTIAICYYCSSYHKRRRHVRKTAAPSTVIVKRAAV